MGSFNAPHSDNIDAVKSDGTATLAARDKISTLGVTLASSSTYYFPLGGPFALMPNQTLLESVHLQWDAVFVGTFTIESSNFARYANEEGRGQDDVTDYSATKGAWIQENPSSAYVSVTSTDGTTGGATVTNLSIAIVGGTAGGCTIHLGNHGTKRMRVKAAVTTGGLVRCGVHGKAS